MAENIRVFSYDTLINKNLLKKTIPTAKDIEPAILYGFVRVFNIPSASNPPIAILNAEKSEWNQRINGITFKIPKKNFEELKYTRKEYEMVQVEIKDFCDETETHKAYFFRMLHYEAYPYQENSQTQREYLKMCYDGCRNFGNDFIEEFKNTTFIGRKTLKELECRKRISGEVIDII